MKIYVTRWLDQQGAPRYISTIMAETMEKAIADAEEHSAEYHTNAEIYECELPEHPCAFVSEADKWLAEERCFYASFGI